MYKRHKILIIVLSIIVFFAASMLNADYSGIAEASISVMSIAIAVYIGAASVILGSSYAEKMKGQVDPEIKTKTSLGVLSSYLRIAGSFNVSTIVISTIYVLNLDNHFMNLFPERNSLCVYFRGVISQMISSFACCLFAVNIVFMYLILEFLINSMTKSVS